MAKPTKSTTPETAEKETKSTEKELTQDQKLVQILESTDGAEYLKIVETTGQFTKAELFEDDAKSGQFIKDLEAWKLANRPKPTAPKVEDNVQIPCQYYRVMSRNGDEHMYRMWQTGEKEGLKLDIVYAQEKNEITGEMFTTSAIESQTIHYLIPFSRDLAKEWVKYAQTVVKTSQVFVCYLVIKGTTIEITEEQFSLPFPEVEKCVLPIQTL